ncbi:MAG TPA: endonuclease/exonuclease/phosphatase family protein [Patescibacteria group bacterium]|jgi:endonuclease/exonuclease/phosphatase family metal-dependent hydrolase|nr:endonuclease/exonuclease/phosphatase family protein [Patescibacteria group bacterium]
MKLTILQWNVWYKEDIRNITKFLREHPSDVVCLQELTIQDAPEIGHTPDYIAEQLGYNHFYKEIDLGEGKIKLANGIFSKYPIVSTNWQWINQPTGTGHYDDEYRAYIEVTLDVNNTALTVATTHMSYTNGFVSTLRKEQELRHLVDILNTKKSNFIFSGDLNATPDSLTIKMIGNLLQNVGPTFDKPTWTTKPFSYDGFEETKLRWRLDYIFASQDVKLLETEILKTEYSDHLPVWAVVEV